MVGLLKGAQDMGTNRSIAAVCIFVMLAGTAFAEQGTFRVRVVPAPPNLSAQVTFIEPSGNNILDGEETAKLYITLKNQGEGDAFDVKAVLGTDRKTTGLEFDRELHFGTVPAKGTFSQTVDLRATKDIPSTDVKLSIEFREVNGFPPDTVNLAFRTKAFEPPNLVVADVGIADFNGNGKIEPTETVELTVRIQNIGNGVARDVVAEVEFGANTFPAAGGDTRFNIRQLDPGKYHDVKFFFYTNKNIRNGERIPIAVAIQEARPQYKVSKDLALVMNAPQKQVQDLVVLAEDTPRSSGPITLATGLSVDVDQNIPEGEKAGEYDMAVVFGNRRYFAPGLHEVEYAERDAAIMKEYLLRTFGFDPEKVYFEMDAGISKFITYFGPPGSPEKGKIYKLAKASPVRPNIFVYYVGHGAPDLASKEAYFVPVDANLSELDATGYKLQTFYENLGKIPAKRVTIVLDSCFSGDSEKGMLFRGISPGSVRVKQEYSAPENALLLTSGAANQVSTWYPQKRHSLFTYYFLKGVRGEADSNGDGAITTGEMRAYLGKKVPYEAMNLRGIEQNPVVSGKSDQEILVRLKK